MDEYHEDGGLGPRFRNIFIAFLVSNFVSPVLIWLGIEYNKVSKDLNELGSKESDPQLLLAAKRFRIASVLTITTFAAGIAMGIVLSSFMFQFVSVSLMTTSMTALANVMLGVFDPAFIFFLGLLALGIANNFVLSSAWTAFLPFVKKIDDFSAPKTISYHANRVIKGLKRSIASGFLFIPVIILYIVLFTILFGMILGGPIMNPYVELAIAIPILVIAVVGLVLSLQGLINQAIGLFDFSKALLSGAEIKHGDTNAKITPEFRDSQPSFGAQARTCPRCNALLPDDPDSLFCPNCGSKIKSE